MSDPLFGWTKEKIDAYEAALKELARVTEWVNTFRGTGVTNDGRRACIYIPPPVRQGGGAKAASTLPQGQYQYQVYQVTSQNVSGWDFVRVHPPT